MVDRYTKLVLAVIAASLVVIAGQGFVGSASGQLGSGCGTSKIDACYIRSGGSLLDAIPVTVVGR